MSDTTATPVQEVVVTDEQFYQDFYLVLCEMQTLDELMDYLATVQ